MDIQWLSGPKNALSVRMEYVFNFPEKFIRDGDIGTFYGVGDEIKLEFDLGFSQIMSLDHMTFNLFIQELAKDIDDDDELPNKYETIILDESPFESNTANTFRWCLTDIVMDKIRKIKPKSVIKSAIFMMFGLKFQCWLYVCYMYILYDSSIAIVMYTSKW